MLRSAAAAKPKPCYCYRQFVSSIVEVRGLPLCRLGVTFAPTSGVARRRPGSATWGGHPKVPLAKWRGCGLDELLLRRDNQVSDAAARVS